MIAALWALIQVPEQDSTSHQCVLNLNRAEVNPLVSHHESLKIHRNCGFFGPAVTLAREVADVHFRLTLFLKQTQSSFPAAGRAPLPSTSIVDVDLRNGTLAAKKRLTQLIHKVVFCLENAVQYCVRKGGPLYIVVASALIGSVVLVYFGFVFPQVLASNTKLVASCHLTGGLFCLLNIIFNYVACITTDPGSAQVLDKPGYQMVALQCQRHCKRCNKPKPPLAHHCHICGRCVLRMDHHCPWMHSCVGFHNYRFFVLFTMYLWLGSAYSAGMLFSELARAGQLSRRRRGEAVYPYVLLCPFVLSAAVSCALTALVGWHVYLIWHAQSTIDMLNFWRDSKLAKEQGETLVHPYDLGPIRNFQEVFDVSGKRLWWIRWMLPSRARRRGDGIFFPTMYDSLHAQPQELSSATWALQDSMEVLSSSEQHMV